MAATTQTWIQLACLQYDIDMDFREFVLQEIERICRLNPTVSSNPPEFFDTPYTNYGTPLAKYVLDKFSQLNNKRPQSSS